MVCFVCWRLFSLWCGVGEESKKRERGGGLRQKGKGGGVRFRRDTAKWSGVDEAGSMAFLPDKCFVSLAFTSGIPVPSTCFAQQGGLSHLRAPPRHERTELTAMTRGGMCSMSELVCRSRVREPVEVNGYFGEYHVARRRVENVSAKRQEKTLELSASSVSPQLKGQQS